MFASRALSSYASSSYASSSFRPTLQQGIGFSALLWWMSGLPYGGFALGWIALAPLLWSLDGVTARARFFAGWKCGFWAFALVNWWIILAVTRGANVIGAPSIVGTLLGIVGVLIIALAHGLGIGLVALVWHTSSTRWRRAPYLLPILAAASWTIFDWARCSGALAHSWGAPAYSQTADLALLQIASVVGQHGLSFLCVWLAASTALWLSRTHDWRSRGRTLWLAPIAVLSALHFWGALQLRRDFDGGTLRVLLVQTASQSGVTKMQSAFAQAYEQTFRARGDFDLVVWPETTFRVTRRVKVGNEYSIGGGIDSLELRQIAELCQRRGISILCGVDVASIDRLGRETRSNEAMLLASDGFVQSSAKSHLVPFGERAPFETVLPWLSTLAPTPAMQAGTPTILHLKNRDDPNHDIALGALICFESCFIEPSRSLTRSIRLTRSRDELLQKDTSSTRGGQLLLVLTNDDWFGGSEAPAQHRMMSQMRAVENRRWVAQSANGGYTFAIDSHGRTQAQSHYGIAQALPVEIGIAPIAEN